MGHYAEVARCEPKPSFRDLLTNVRLTHNLQMTNGRRDDQRETATDSTHTLASLRHFPPLMVHLHGPSGHIQHNSGTHIRTWRDGTDMIRWDKEETSKTKLKRNLDKYNTNSVDSRQFSGQLNDRKRIRTFLFRNENFGTVLNPKT